MAIFLFAPQTEGLLPSATPCHLLPPSPSLCQCRPPSPGIFGIFSRLKAESQHCPKSSKQNSWFLKFSKNRTLQYGENACKKRPQNEDSEIFSKYFKNEGGKAFSALPGTQQQDFCNFWNLPRGGSHQLNLGEWGGTPSNTSMPKGHHPWGFKDQTCMGG